MVAHDKTSMMLSKIQSQARRRRGEELGPLLLDKGFNFAFFDDVEHLDLIRNCQEWQSKREGFDEYQMNDLGNVEEWLEDKFSHDRCKIAISEFDFDVSPVFSVDIMEWHSNLEKLLSVFPIGFRVYDRDSYKTASIESEDQKFLIEYGLWELRGNPQEQ